ncbi:unnamed protein product [Ascophyllum nodosum]
MVYKIRLPLHFRPLNHPNMKNPCTGLKDFGMYGCTRELEDSVYHNTAPRTAQGP